MSSASMPVFCRRPRMGRVRPAAHGAGQAGRAHSRPSRPRTGRVKLARAPVRPRARPQADGGQTHCGLRSGPLDQAKPGQDGRVAPLQAPASRCQTADIRRPRTPCSDVQHAGLVTGLDLGEDPKQGPGRGAPRALVSGRRSMMNSCAQVPLAPRKSTG